MTLQGAISVSGCSLQARKPLGNMSNLSQAYVLGLMAEGVHKLPLVEGELARAQEKACEVDSELP